MCNLSEAILERGIREGIEQGRTEGIAAERIIAVLNMLELGVPKEQILTKYTMEEYEEARKQMTTTV